MQRDEGTAKEMRGAYQRRLLGIRGEFEAGASGAATIRARSGAVDDLVRGLWGLAVRADGRLAGGVALVAVGGYGRAELFPYSDVDLMFLLDAEVKEQEVKDAVRSVSQELWDSGLRLSPGTRKLAECERWAGENGEFTFSLLDHRLLCGDEALYGRLVEGSLPKVLLKEKKAILGRLKELTEARHAKYGGTLFHLEPNIKDCPGGMRDVHVCGWLKMLLAVEPGGRDRGVSAEGGGQGLAEGEGFREAVEFLRVVRCFLHYRHDRDDNTLDWQAQDLAAAGRLGLRPETPVPDDLGAGRDRDGGVDAAYWMRLYFRHARSIDRLVTQRMEQIPAVRGVGGRLVTGLRRAAKAEPAGDGFRVEQGCVVMEERGAAGDPAEDPDVVLQVFTTMARTGCRLGVGAEARMSQALPLLSAHLEEGPALWHGLAAILTGAHAGRTLRAMHTLGVLDLLIPEFHGIDALVIRDAYHRYTVDEHTFVLIDTLHRLEATQESGKGDWAGRFGVLARELPHPELLYLMALLHDTGKGRNTGDHAQEGVRLARGVLARLDLDAYESGMVLGLIQGHLEMSAALRRDIFDAETVRAFAEKVQTPEMLKMLALFTYADIDAVHPDALTPWKAENLWRLYIATANFLDRAVDDERVGLTEDGELVERVASLLPGEKAAVTAFLEGFPKRYLRTRTADQVRSHYRMAKRFDEDAVQLEFRYQAAMSEITLVTPDRALLFATMTGALAAWGMNVVTADAFSNRHGTVVDSFRFTDSSRTLEMNASEHAVFVKSVHDVVAGTASVENLLSGRRRSRRKGVKVVVPSQVEFDDTASTHSTLMQVVAQDTPGLLRALSVTLAERGCSIEVALVDTEGEMAIDVFYLTRQGAKLEAMEEEGLRAALLAAMEENAR